MGDSQPYRPHERGFDKTVYHAGGGIGNTGDPWGNDYFDDTYFQNGVPTKYEGYCTDVFFREGMKFIEEHKNESFFCYIATNAPHGPLNVEPHYVDMYRDLAPTEDRARFYGMITNIDENFGKLQAKLDDLNLTDNTILVFMTDNGTASGIDLDPDQFPIEGPGSYNAGMRGKKGSQYDGGHRIPFFLRYPAAGWTGGRDIRELTSYVDVMPTLLDLCNVDIPAERQFHGRSLVPLVAEDGDPAFSSRIVVSDTQRIARPMKWRKSSVMKERWRLVNGKELYDISADPSQRHDISQSNPDVVKELRESYDRWWEVVSEQFDRDVPIALGVDGETVKITTHDIRNEACNTAFNHRQVRLGHICNGFWEVDVKTPGEYTIELRRWPEEAGYAADAGIDGDDVEWRKDAIKESDATHYSGGVAIPIEWARLEIGGGSYQQELITGSTGAVFNLTLETGHDRLYAAFHDRIERTIAPYYVYVTKR